MNTEDEIKLIGHMIDEIEMHMKENDFQRDFFDSLYNQYVNKAFLSPKQVESLQRIYERVTQ